MGKKLIPSIIGMLRLNFESNFCVFYSNNTLRAPVFVEDAIVATTDTGYVTTTGVVKHCCHSRLKITNDDETVMKQLFFIY